MKERHFPNPSKNLQMKGEFFTNFVFISLKNDEI